MPASPAIRPVLEQEEHLEEPVEQARFALNHVPLPARIHFSRPLTDEELLQFCAENDGLEIESDADGSITVMTPAGPNVSRLNQILAARLLLWAETNNRGTVFGPDLGVRFADKTLRAPDAAWLSLEKWDPAAWRKKRRKGYLPVCPEFVVELRSPSDRASKIEAKMEFWMKRGAELGWLIDPQRKLAMIYRTGQEPETLLRPDFLEGEGPVAGFRIEMKTFWE
jgi:Uma2 family endonuclease